MANDVRVVRTTTDSALQKAEVKYRKYKHNEMVPFARNTSFTDLAKNVIKDRDGLWAHPIYLYESDHITTIGVNELCRKTIDYLDIIKKSHPFDTLSVSAGMNGDHLTLHVLLRVYDESNKPRLKGLYDFLGENDQKYIAVDQDSKLYRSADDDSFNNESSIDLEEYEKKVEEQIRDRNNGDPNVPFLNRVDRYIPETKFHYDDTKNLIYDLLSKDKMTSTNLPYEEFIAVFNDCMNYITRSEIDSYINVLRGQAEKSLFLDVIEAYINRTMIDSGRMPIEDVPVLMEKLDKALFQLYIIQDLINDPDISDIKITAPDSVRVRIKGLAYLSNITFIDENDYQRFIRGIAILNNVDLRVPVQTFTDEQDENFILRFSITAPYLTNTGFPIIHIRKLPRKKMMSEDLIKAGMMDEKLRDYLIDCGRKSRGIVFAGPPGSGKTTILNWFLEDAYESSAEILVIQENDELFTNRKGVMFEHVVQYPQKGERACTLEDLGQMALVAGANVFVIGEAKGAEICSAIRLANTGCRTAITIHSQSSTETVDRMANLAMLGDAKDSDQAKRMLRSFQTIVYLADFKVQEIAEIIRFNEETKLMEYRMIYKRGA